MGLFCYRHPHRIAVATIERKIFPPSPAGEKEITVRSPVCQECAKDLSGMPQEGAICRHKDLRVDGGMKEPESGPAPMLMDENAVVDAVCSFLIQNGYAIKSSCSATERGIDVCVEKPSTGQRIHVGAIGATSSRPGNSRFGKPYTESQVFDRFAKGFYTVFQMNGKADGGARYVLAVPDSHSFRKYLAPVKPAFEAAGIGVLLVSAGRQVRVFTDFQL